jgi:hypothetical protein
VDAINLRAGKSRPYRVGDKILYLTDMKNAIFEIRLNFIVLKQFLF